MPPATSKEDIIIENTGGRLRECPEDPLPSEISASQGRLVLLKRSASRVFGPHIVKKALQWVLEKVIEGA